ncbi:hypothetical protein LDE05_00210 [Lactobacillus delbrueckii subsp. bulgaricus]|uniref:Surface layer protein A domain-containing protein n=1 Tax=Lactobacillus delbrueckii subsp. bulgaricus (strain ATCC 11842 / DSM 20081 / BCRC 10696 / JCM 1002 / NBRC 13953 / NCIMB 11778 / NCTC 12712 / WDCM 00102 / Lb 14) TaxID=390333 RepID=Q1GBQ7_LACDA|nr:hypothetical protein [Lactobacillus delbrueckii]KRN39362.1 hypothetical protein IV47_GL000441 [Lactobacillus delbrueckii subsp. bulgaricus ATCC 11842 = JCM 1002]MDG9748417.1 hypothetical protein [Lactobacillus delbrueckii subsp. bulgaricus ATCC 11842 = JCM 1002]GEB90158.1 hypothetical protein LDE05_00210 [Lactobacillus delbrueckii subsp. bulgaricus]CAI97187.1 Hypothetical protein Ldb0349 [Lactobacillus delbrueckii subsp. bulgaricus ATCC 11842 = JCM 1002]
MKFTKKIAFASASLALTLATPAALLTQNVAFAKTTTVKQATKVKVTKKTTPFYHKDGSKFTKKKPYVYGGWKSTVAYKNTSYNVVKTVTIKGAKYYYIGNDAYLKASDVKVTATKTVKSSSTSSAKKASTSSSKSSSKKTSSTSSSTSSSSSSKKTVTQIQVTKKTTPFYHKDGSKFTKKSPYVYQGWKSTVAYKGTKYKVSKTITIKGSKYYYIGNSAYLKASAVKVIASK